MRIAAVSAAGFRNLDGRIPLSEPLAVIVGENNAGKSNVVEALRILFQPDVGPAGRRWLTEQDFRHDGRGTRVTDVLRLEAELTDLTQSDRVRLVTCLAPSLGPDSARLRLRAKLAADGRVNLEWFGGDSEHPDIDPWARDAVTWTYMRPLRDAAADLRPGRENRLVELISQLAPPGHADRDAIENIAKDANDALAAVSAILAAKTGVQTRLRGMTGDGSFTQRADLLFAEPRFERIAGSLRALAGTLVPLELMENGLGYNNLLYMAVLLAALADSGDAALRLLLVEEPEAHLHPQLQDLLMRYLESESGANTQIVVTSHSPNLASAASVERVTVMIRSTPEGEISSRAPKDFGLTPKQLGHLRRFLDVTKASLLFARGVILVEGIAEQLLLPEIAGRLNRPLSRDGVAVINVGGVAFGPFVELFSTERLPHRVAIVSDSDPPAKPDPADLEGGDAQVSPVAASLLSRQDDQLKVCLARKTLEWDIAAAGNWDILLAALTPIKPRVATALASDLADSTPEEKAERLLAKVADVKGAFAQELAALLGDETAEFLVPGYLGDAVMWVTRDSPSQGG